MDQLERPLTLTEATVRHIGEAIIAGQFPGGSQLAEIPLARQLNMSRGTVRAALRELQDLGLVEVSPRKGAFVSLLTRERAAEIISLRALLESYAARLASEAGATPDLFAKLEDCLDEQRRAAESHDGMASVKADMRFHETLTEACGHRLLIEHLSSLQTQSRRLLVHVKQYGADLEHLVTSHLPIVDALKNGDPTLVEQAVHTHITSAGERLLAKMSSPAAHEAPVGRMPLR